MSSSAMPGPRPVGPHDDPSPALTDDAASEFISEGSPELRAIWTDQAQIPPSPMEVPGEPDAGAWPELLSSMRAPSKAPAKTPPSALRAVGPMGTVGPVAGHRAGGTPVPITSRNTRRTGLLIVIGLAVVAASLYGGLWQRFRGPGASPAAVAPPVSEGVATIVSRPSGAEVFINGEGRGTTPLKLTLPVGTYEMELRTGGAKRTLALTVESATAVREVVDLGPSGDVGGLEIASDTAGARVTVDGVVRGVTPLALANLAPGPHRVGIGSGDQVVYRDVTVTAGSTSSVVASLVPTGASGGWLTINSPIEMQVLEDAQVIGTTGAVRLMLPAGRHRLQLVAAPYEFETTVDTQIAVGRTLTVPVSVPDGSLSVNALPWADVFVDGKSIGSTPIGNVRLPIGTHEVVFRHPQLGERRQSVRITARTPARASVDLTR